MGLRRMVLLHWKVFLEALTAFAVVVGLSGAGSLQDCSDAFAPGQGASLPAGRELLSETPGLSRQSFPGPIASPPPVHVRCAPAEASGPKNRASFADALCR